jgi:hypothetical protein
MPLAGISFLDGMADENPRVRARVSENKHEVRSLSAVFASAKTRAKANEQSEVENSYMSTSHQAQCE